MSTKRTDVPDRPHGKAPHFETFFANAFSLRLGDNDCTLRFLIAEDPANFDAAELQSAVFMTPRSMKVLASILLDAVLEFEHATGAALPVRDERQQKLFDAAKSGWTSELPATSDSNEH